MDKSITDKKQLIKQAFWDKTINVEEIYAFLNGKIDNVPF